MHFFIILLFFSFAQAQTVVSRADLMRFAERSATVEVARARVLSAEVQAGQSGFSGSVSGSAGVSGVAPTTGDTVFSYPWNLQLNLRFAGLWGEAADTRVQALLNLERAKRALVSARIRALVQAVNLWHGLRRGLAGLEVAQAALTLALLEDQAAEVRFGTGAISLADRERVGLSLELARLEFAQAEIAVSGVHLQLEVLFGLRDAVPSADWQVLSEPVVSNFEAREDVFEARASLKVADLQRGAAQRELLPTLNLETSFRGSAGLLSLSTNQFLAFSAAYSYPVALPVGVSSSFSIGLSLSIPIQPFASVAAQNRTVIAAQGLLEITLALARAEVTNKRSAVVMARSNLELAVRTLEFSVRQLERIKTRASVGLVSILELKRAELEVLKSLRQLKNAQADLDISVLELSSALAVVMGVQ